MNVLELLLYSYSIVKGMIIKKILIFLGVSNYVDLTIYVTFRSVDIDLPV